MVVLLSTASLLAKLVRVVRGPTSKSLSLSIRRNNFQITSSFCTKYVVDKLQGLSSSRVHSDRSQGFGPVETHDATDLHRVR